ncbi:gamma-glutamyltransferase [Marinobacterium sediminicola]|uniref:Glutathione hydrolase proenzyme n=1 Tax=Marinobacterium sediminicola TaxID=518898 RepID=A0ABY1S1V2_9GAMM|nr:gamma-glutamyltransferase [Marinobacterium sediminicola]ULG69329.1 gamma-glutamyltransferase [Marinobacterium sediminicola]SMR75474.1 gamma-glutamyltranspeptidase / glutathione hydrolase [Marinobacterium sediminicola]
MIRFWTLLSLLLILHPVYAINESLAPESATGWQRQETVVAESTLVVSAHPLATHAGMAMLDQNGSAIDAAIAVQAMLTLVEPQSSGIGGGAFLLYWDAKQQQLFAYDGRETAPASVTPDLFLNQDGSPMPWQQALVGGRSVGTPGVLRMLELAHQRHGKLPWQHTFEPAIRQAREGFSVTPRLHKLIADGINPGLGRYTEAREYFFTTAGEPLPVGTLRQNPELADSLTLIALQGADAFYQGPLASKIVAAVKAAGDNPGRLQPEDLANYQARERSPLCRLYREYRICGFPPPTSGGITLLQILGLMATQELIVDALPDLEFSHRLTQASRLAYADRGRYLADGDFVDVPIDALLAPDYLQQRAKLIDPTRDMGQAAPGEPLPLQRSDDRSPERPSTSHFVIRDAKGNLVSMTTSIEMAFGSTLMAGGFLLNNQLTDFSFVPELDGRPVANRIAPGKRPRSSMAPVIVFDKNNQPVAALGSPGGSRIINYVAQTLLLMLHTDLSLQEILHQGHISNRNGVTELEQDTAAEQLLFELQDRGHAVKIRELNSGIHALRKRDDGRWESGVDPRREGLALGR